MTAIKEFNEKFKQGDIFKLNQSWFFFSLFEAGEFFFKQDDLFVLIDVHEVNILGLCMTVSGAKFNSVYTTAYQADVFSLVQT